MKAGGLGSGFGDVWNAWQFGEVTPTSDFFSKTNYIALMNPNGSRFIA